jgi:hypothetical protein
MWRGPALSEVERPADKCLGKGSVFSSTSPVPKGHLKVARRFKRRVHWQTRTASHRDA